MLLLVGDGKRSTERKNGATRDGWPPAAYAALLLLTPTVARLVTGRIDQDESLAGLGGWRERMTLDGGDFLTRGSTPGTDHSVLTRNRGWLPRFQRLFSHLLHFLKRETVLRPVAR